MADVANPPAPKNFNGVLTAQGWGTIYVKITTIAHGIALMTSESRTRVGRALYTTRRAPDVFDVAFVCTSYDEYVAFGDWIRGYGYLLAQDAPTVGPVRVMCPARNFDRVAIPSGISMGDTAEEYVFPFSINFMGSRDPVPLNSSLVSTFSMPISDDPSLPYYAPSGTQLSGSQLGADSIFDVAPSPLAQIVTPPPVNDNASLGSQARDRLGLSS